MVKRLFVLASLLILFLTPDQALAQVESSPKIITFSGIERAWKYGTGEGARVAVLDWLFDMSSEAAEKYVDAVSLVPGEGIGDMDAWHGEWMADIVHRIAPDAKVIPIRIRPSCREQDRSLCDSQAYEKYLIEGIRYAADHGAAAVTCSAGPVKITQELLDAIAYAWEKGTIFINVHPEYVDYRDERFVFCEGDECIQDVFHSGIVSVPDHTVNPSDERDLYVWPYAPDPVFRDGWGFSNGPPTIGGVVALMKSVNRDLGPADIKEILIETGREEEGFLIMDAEAAVRESLERK